MTKLPVEQDPENWIIFNVESSLYSDSNKEQILEQGWQQLRILTDMLGYQCGWTKLYQQKIAHDAAEKMSLSWNRFNLVWSKRDDLLHVASLTRDNLRYLLKSNGLHGQTAQGQSIHHSKVWYSAWKLKRLINSEIGDNAADCIQKLFRYICGCSITDALERQDSRIITGKGIVRDETEEEFEWFEREFVGED